MPGLCGWYIHKDEGVSILKLDTGTLFLIEGGQYIFDIHVQLICYFLTFRHGGVYHLYPGTTCDSFNFPDFFVIGSVVLNHAAVPPFPYLSEILSCHSELPSPAQPAIGSISRCMAIICSSACMVQIQALNILTRISSK